MACILAAAAGTAQSISALKKEMKTREAALAKDDADGMVELARWAREKGLLRDYKRLLEKALKANPDHEGANTELGMVRFEGEWVPRAKAEMLRQRALDAEMKEKGLVQVDDVWVDKDHARDAKMGIFWHEGEQVSKFEKQQLNAGKVRHPRTGEFILPADAERAAADRFPLGEAGWGDLERANEYHADRDHPWTVRTAHGLLVSTMPLDKIEEYKSVVDSAIESVLPVFLGKHPPPAFRPVVWVVPTSEQYREIGTAIGGGGSSYGAFLPQAVLNVPGHGEARPAFANNLENWGPYYVRHAAALAFAAGHCNAGEIEAPQWFLRGVGGLAERFYAPGQIAHFGRQHIQKGGVQSVKTWFNSFDIHGAMEPRMIDFNIFQAGLLLDFAMRGGDDKALEAIQDVSKAIVEQPKSAVRAMEKLEKVLIDKEDELRAYLQQLTR